MMVMPGKKLAHSPHPLGTFIPSGGTWAAIYCVYKGPRSKQKGSTSEEEELSHPRNQTRRAHTQSQSFPLAPWGMRDWFPRNTLHVHRRNQTHAAMVRTYTYLTYVGLRLRWRRHRCCEHRLWCARISGESVEGGGGVRVD